MRTINRVIFGCLFSFLAVITLAQELPSAGTDRLLAVSRANQPSDYFKLSDDGSDGYAGVVVGVLDRVTEQDGSNTSQLSPSALEFAYNVTGDSVQLRVTLVFKSQDCDSAQGREVLVGTYVIRPGEPATLAELTLFGLKPRKVSLVSAKAPGSGVPTVSNRTSSLAVDKADENRAEYQIFLRNTSQVAVAGVVVSVVGSNGVCDPHDFRGVQRPLIAPSETRELEMEVPRNESGRLGPGGESCPDTALDIPKMESGDSAKLPGSAAIIIDAVDFEDGTYEGDSVKAAMMESMRLSKEPEREHTTGKSNTAA